MKEKKRILRGARVEMEELRLGKTLEEAFEPYLRYKAPIPVIAKELKLNLPNTEYWIRKIRKAKKEK